MKLGGVIYLYDISLSRMLGTTRNNLEVFQKLCGDDAFQSVILGTTKWGDVFWEDGDKRAQQVRDNYWRDMLDHGSEIFKFEDSSESAWTMVDSILKLNRKAGDAHFTDAKEGDIIVPYVSCPFQSIALTVSIA